VIFLSLIEGVKRANSMRAGGGSTGHWWFDSDIGFYLVLNLVILIFIGMGMALWAIVQSHRIAGPALRFRRTLKQMLRRDYDFYMRLRKRDYFQDVAEEINVLNNALKAKDVVVADAALRLEALALSLGDKARADEVREVAAELADVVLPLPEPPPPEPSAVVEVAVRK
jgi:hypothetical protein